MLFALQNPPALIVQVVEEPAQSMTFADVILGSLGVAGISLLIAIVLGAVLALLLVRWNRRHPAELDHMPPISPQTSFPSRSTVAPPHP